MSKERKRKKILYEAKPSQDKLAHCRQLTEIISENTEQGEKENIERENQSKRNIAEWGNMSQQAKIRILREKRAKNKITSEKQKKHKFDTFWFGSE